MSVWDCRIKNSWFRTAYSCPPGKGASHVAPCLVHIRRTHWKCSHTPTLQGIAHAPTLYAPQSPRLQEVARATPDSHPDKQAVADAVLLYRDIAEKCQKVMRLREYERKILYNSEV